MRLAAIDNEGNVLTVVEASYDYTMDGYTMIPDPNNEAYAGGTYLSGVFSIEPIPADVVLVNQLSEYKQMAKNALAATDKTVTRVTEAVSIGTTTWDTSDVVAYMNYRKSLRAEISATTVGTLPIAPPFPKNT
jgi:hypothetical protein